MYDTNMPAPAVRPALQFACNALIAGSSKNLLHISHLAMR
jgi:hypothetical protein